MADPQQEKLDEEIARYLQEQVMSRLGPDESVFSNEYKGQIRKHMAGNR